MTKKLAISRRVLRKLSREQLTDLGDFIQELLRSLSPEAKHRGKEVADKQPGGKTYRLVLTRCGKANCKCVGGRLHGPYWYAYWSEGGRTRALYVGKKLPQS
jgi:hypothetical protein